MAAQKAAVKRRPKKVAPLVRQTSARRPVAAAPPKPARSAVVAARFAGVIELIEAARTRAYQPVNAELVSL